MAVGYDIDDDIRYHAQNLLHYNNLLIKQCDSWLSAEEGNRNMEKQIRERLKKESLEKSEKKKMKRETSNILQFFGIKKYQ
jgi:hypothetical protein